MTPTLEERREAERQKYITLQRDRPNMRYGSSNHGSGAMDLVASWHPGLVVDFGCGCNDFCVALRSRGIDAVGIDFAFPQANYQCYMHNVPDLANGCADVVTSFDALEHLLPEDVDPTFAEMHRIGKLGGRFVFSIAYRPSRITVDRQNLHPTVQPQGWWLDQIGRWGTVEQTGPYIVGTWT